MKVKRSKYVFFYHQFQPKLDLENFLYEKVDKCFENSFRKEPYLSKIMTYAQELASGI